MNPLFPVFERFGNRFATIESCTPVGGGFSGALVWKLKSHGAVFAVRGWPSDADPDRIRALHRLLRHVASQNVPISVPLADSHGETCLRHNGRWWQIEPWLPGQANFRTAPSEPKLVAAMKTLAEFHRAAETFVPTAGEAKWFGGRRFGPAPALLDREALLSNWVFGGDRAMVARQVSVHSQGEFADLARRVLQAFDRHGETVLAAVQQAGETHVPLVPCLRDVWHDHLLFVGDDVSGLVDPAACRRDTVATDLSRLLGSLLGDDFRRWNQALRAYAHFRPLSAEEFSLVPVLDRSGLLLSAATWLRRRYLLNAPCETPAVLGRLREIMARLERLP